MAIQTAIIWSQRGNFDSYEVKVILYDLEPSALLFIRTAVAVDSQPALLSHGPRDRCPTCLPPCMRLPRDSSSAQVFKASPPCLWSQPPQDKSEGESLLKGRSGKSFLPLFPVCLSILLQASPSSSKSSFAWDTSRGHRCGLSVGARGLRGARAILGRALLSLHLLKHLWKWALTGPRDGQPNQDCCLCKNGFRWNLINASI